MKRLLPLTSVLIIALLSGCASLDSRISKNQSDFNSWPAEVQSTIRAGKVDVGFTRQQVKVALGEPDRSYTRKTAEGESEIWAYFDKKPGFSLGLGIGGGSYRSGVGGGVGYSTRQDHLDEASRVVFEGDKVVSLESRTDQ